MTREFAVLIVDDDADIAQNLKDVFEAEGYTAAVATDGQMALALDHEKVFGLGLIDIGLPDIPGVELIERLASISPGMEFIIITGRASLDTAIQAVGLKNIIAYETKPLNIDQLMALVRQVGERKRVEEALRESEERYRRIFEDSGIGMVLVDSEGRYVRVNKSMTEIIGYSERELLSMSVNDVTYPGDLTPDDTAIRQLWTGESNGIATEKRYVHKDGHVIWGAINVSPIGDSSGKTLYTLGQLNDITERKQAEEREQQLQQELNLSSRLASIGELAAGVAHEINNPLTGIIGFSQRLLRKNISEEVSRDVERIHNEARRVAKIVENLLTFARRRGPSKEYADINEILARTLELRVYELRASNIELEVDLAPDLPQVMVDFQQIEQVFLNIILNAEQAMTEANRGGKLTIKTELTKDYARISFADDGPGITAANFGKLFDPFFTTRGDRGGTGLGLSACHGIMEEHGGKIYAESKPGKGVTFFIKLPLATGAINESKVAKEEPVRRG